MTDVPIPDGSVDARTAERLLAVRRKYEAAKRAALLLAGATLIALAGGMLAILVEVRNTQDTIADCLTPGGECYQRGERAQLVRDTTAANVIELCRRLKVNDCQTPPITTEGNTP